MLHAIILAGLLAPAAGADEPVTFQHRARAPEAAWSMRWDSAQEFHWTAALDGAAAVDNTEHLPTPVRREVRMLPARPGFPGGWEVRDPERGEDGEAEPPFVVVLDQGRLAEWAADTAQVAPLKAGEAALLAVAGLGATPLLWPLVPEGAMTPGTALVVPDGLAERLVDPWRGARLGRHKEHLALRRVAMTLRGATPEGLAVFDVTVELAGVTERAPSQPARSTSSARLAGTWTVDPLTTRPRALHLEGPLAATVDVAQEDLVVTATGQGTWRLDVTWTDGG